MQFFLNIKDDFLLKSTCFAKDRRKRWKTSFVSSLQRIDPNFPLESNSGQYFRFHPHHTRLQRTPSIVSPASTRFTCHKFLASISKVTLGNINQRNNWLVSYYFKLTRSPLTTYSNAFIMVITRGKFVLLKFLFSYNSTIFHWRVVGFSEVTYLEEWLSRIKENLFSERWSRSEISVLHTFQLQEQSARGMICGHSIYQSCHFFHLQISNNQNCEQKEKNSFIWDPFIWFAFFGWA